MMQGKEARKESCQMINDIEKGNRQGEILREEKSLYGSGVQKKFSFSG